MDLRKLSKRKKREGAKMSRREQRVSISQNSLPSSVGRSTESDRLLICWSRVRAPREVYDAPCVGV